MKRIEKKAHLLETAVALFNRHGYHAAGVDRIIAESGIAKTTLYRHFATKEDLILAALRLQDERSRDSMRAFVDQAATDPIEKLLATFDYLEAWFADRAFHGCPFVSAASEYGDETDPIFHEVALHKRLVLAYFEELAHAAGLADAKRVAEIINLLHEGAVAVAQVTRDPATAGRAKEAARRLLADEQSAFA
ncbi:MAG: helix-turn-helix domain-containing protein [Pseudomonadota bacterium]